MEKTMLDINNLLMATNPTSEYTFTGLLLSIGLSFSLGMIFFSVASRCFENLRSNSIFILSGILPICISAIIWAVSSNFFLSLGLIGALSIVRYRTPVKNPVDLAYLLGLISIGIISIVSPIGAVITVTILSVSVVILFRVSVFKGYKNEFNQELNGKYIYFESSSDLDFEDLLENISKDIIKWEIDYTAKRFRCFVSVSSQNSQIKTLKILGKYDDNAYISLQG